MRIRSELAMRHCLSRLGRACENRILSRYSGVQAALVDNLLEIIHKNVERISLANDLSSAPAQFHPQRFVFKKLRERFDQRLQVSRWNKQTIHFIFDNVSYSPAGRTN